MTTVKIEIIFWVDISIQHSSVFLYCVNYNKITLMYVLIIRNVRLDRLTLLYKNVANLLTSNNVPDVLLVYL